MSAKSQAALRPGPLWVKSSKAQHDHMFSGWPPTADLQLGAVATRLHALLRSARSMDARTGLERVQGQRGNSVGDTCRGAGAFFALRDDALTRMRDRAAEVTEIERFINAHGAHRCPARLVKVVCCSLQHRGHDAAFQELIAKRVRFSVTASWFQQRIDAERSGRSRRSMNSAATARAAAAHRQEKTGR
jgi:hypothetical protein